MAPPPRPLAEAFWALHRLVYRASGGRVGKGLFGRRRPSLLLVTRGRRSGEPRATPLMYLEQGDGFVVAASNLGAERPPAWWLNLEAHPEAEVRIGRERRRVRARETEGEERERLWKRLVDHYSDYAVYDERTDRHIPVVVLEPA